MKAEKQETKNCLKSHKKDISGAFKIF